GAGWSVPATTRSTVAAASRPQIRPGSRRSWPRRGRNRAAAAGRRTGAGSHRRWLAGTAGRRTPRRAARGNPPRARPPARRRAGDRRGRLRSASPSVDALLLEYGQVERCQPVRVGDDVDLADLVAGEGEG